jgi:Mrp family chromosome partitioning ATPase
MGGALALGLLLAIGLAFLLEGLDSGVDSTDDVEAHLGRPMWGSVLVSRTSKKQPSVLETRGSDFVALAAKLAASAIGRRPHTLVVQAANAGAGATTVTSGIARALAETYGLKTVVVDASKQSAVGLLGCSPMPARELPLPSGNVARLWNVSPTLSVASFGKEVSPESRTAAVEILDALRSSASYDFILVDAGESLPQHLRALFTQSAAGVVVVAEWGRTRSEVLERLQEESRRDGVQLIAGILNKRRFLIPEPLYRVL